MHKWTNALTLSVSSRDAPFVISKATAAFYPANTQNCFSYRSTKFEVIFLMEGGGVQCEQRANAISQDIARCYGNVGEAAA